MKMLKLSVLLLALILFNGCNGATTDDDTSNSTKTSAHDDSDHDHDHGDAPHKGHLIELGHNHEYHAEIVDGHGTTTIYLYDGKLKPIDIGQEKVTLVYGSGEDAKTVEFAAKEGGTSEFVSTDKDLANTLHDEKVECKLRTTIEGKPFTGSFTHAPHH